MNDTAPEPDEDGEILTETATFVDLTVGICEWLAADGRWYLEEDFKVDGEVWRVHKNDADPFPSKPHAHCVGGAERFIGLTLHLGTRQLFDKATPLNRYMGKKQFARLIELIKPKFPGIRLPLAQ